jgi:hypothetical protein
MNSSKNEVRRKENEQKLCTAFSTVQEKQSVEM